MSELQTTKITDRAGTGSPNFSQGLKISGTDSGLLAPTRTEGETQPDAETSSNGDTFYDTANDTYDILIEDAWVRVIGAGGGAASWTVDLSNVTYDNKSFSTSTQDGNSNTTAFSSDGTKMYSVGNINDTVYQYSMSTAWDVSTASYDNVSLSMSGVEALPFEAEFNPDGTKLYVVGLSGDKIYQYSLTTAFDLSTASYDSVVLSIFSQDSAPNGLAFNTDGTKLYVSGTSGDSVYQYSLSTAYSLNTASYDSVAFSASSQDSNVQSVAFNSDGTKMYITGGTGDSVYQYSLTTAFDISTASYDSISFSTSSQTTSPNSTVFSIDGTKMYVTQYGIVYQYSTGL